jgi:S-adenosylmethionine:diacylglycerol 3-amino-3-carboxypropyl transferase
MGEISHTHPDTGETFGTVYRRGPVVADGGEDVATDESTAENVERPTMKDVDHTPTDGTVTRIWDRGNRTAQNGANR